MEPSSVLPSALVFIFRFSLFFLIPLFFLLIKTKKDARIEEKLKSFNGPPSLPVFGSALRLLTIGGPAAIFQTICFEDVKTFGRLMRVWMLNEPQVVIASAQNAEKILQGMQHHAKSVHYRYLHAWMGLGLLTSKDDHWRVHRKILTPAFHFNILQEFLLIFNRNSKILADKLQKCTGKDGINIFEPFFLCGLDIINESSMGASINAQLQEDAPYVRAVRDMNQFIVNRYFNPLLRQDWTYKLSSLKRKTDKALEIINDFTEKVIAERREYLKSIKTEIDTGNDRDDMGTKKRNLAFIDLLLMAEEDGEQYMKPKDIRDEVSTFMFEGHDTVTTATCWTIFLLGTYPDIQKKVVEELDRVFGNSGRAPTMADLTELKYLERCVKETLRLYPSVPFFERHLREDAVLDCGRVIPAGCTVSFNTFVLHRDPEHFPDPEKFDPDRFLPENSQGRNPYAYLPFSAGPRNCIGQKFALMEEKVVLSTVLRSFRVEAAHKLEDAILEVGLVLRPANGLTVKFHPRKSHPGLRMK